MMDSCVKSFQDGVVFHFLLQSFIGWDINKVDNLTLYVVNCHIITLKYQSFVFFVIHNWFHCICLNFLRAFLWAEQYFFQRKKLNLLLVFTRFLRIVWIEFNRVEKLVVNRIPLIYICILIHQVSYSTFLSKVITKQVKTLEITKFETQWLM